MNEIPLFDVSYPPDTLDRGSKDLLNRLLEKNPHHRVKSILALKRLIFFHNFNFDDVRHRKVSLNCNISLAIHNYSMLHSMCMIRYRREN
jgi:serine/threonine protein kinase